MLAPRQPQQPDHYEDLRTDFAIQEEQRQLNREMHNVLTSALQHYQALRARQAYNDQEIEQRLTRRRETFDWPKPSSTLVAPRRSYHLHAGQQPGRMRIVEAAEAAEREDWERKHG